MTAFTHWRTFGVLPYEGGTFQQPAQLMQEMSYLQARFAEKERQE